MGRAGEVSLGQVPAARRVHGAGTRWLLSFLLFAIAVTAVIAIVAAVAMGQPTVGLVIGLVLGAVFFGTLC